MYFESVQGICVKEKSPEKISASRSTQNQSYEYQNLDVQLYGLFC